MHYRYIYQLIRADKPIGFYLLSWPMIWALLIANEGYLNIRITLIMLLGSWLMRSAGCAINDWADRKFDPHVQRCANRPLACQAMASHYALYYTFILLGLSAGLLLWLNQATCQLALMAALLAFFYPFTKRFFPCPQAFLGLAFAMAVPMAFTATLGHCPKIGWALTAIAVAWPMAYDTIYAMMDIDDDAQLGLYSFALTLKHHTLKVITFFYVIVCIGLILVGLSLDLHLDFYLGMLLAILYIYKIIKTTQKQPLKKDLQAAFMMNHPLGAIITLAFAYGYHPFTPWILALYH